MHDYYRIPLLLACAGGLLATACGDSASTAPPATETDDTDTGGVTQNDDGTDIDDPMDAQMASCDDTAHGGVDERVRFQAESVAFGQACQSETQTRSCDDGTWGNWSGTFGFETCSVQEASSCDGVAHGDQATRTRYQMAQVPFGQQCVEETQTGTCDDGAIDGWSGSFTAEACVVAAPVDCDGGGHGDVQTETFFASATVPFDSTCDGVEQSRTCSNGTWSDWSGDLTIQVCAVGCDGGDHGDVQTEIFFASATVPYDATCDGVEQSRTCNDGTWSDWSGNLTVQACSVLPAGDCDGGAHGDTQTETFFASATVPYDATCDGVEQSRTCHDGTWSDWSGDLTIQSCAVLQPADCDGEPHDTVQERTRFEEAAVQPGNTCVSETQQRTCNDGVWSDFSGTFEAETCHIDGVDCVDFFTGEITLNGESQTRTFYEVDFPSGECVSEEQQSLCTDGEFADWDGFLFTGCASLGDPAQDVASCRTGAVLQPGAAWSQCIEWTGPDADTDAASQCNVGDVLDLDRPCPDTGTFAGRCVIGTSAQYVYEEGFAAFAEASCSASGGTWEGP